MDVGALVHSSRGMAATAREGHHQQVEATVSKVMVEVTAMRFSKLHGHRQCRFRCFHAAYKNLLGVFLEKTPQPVRIFHKVGDRLFEYDTLMEITSLDCATDIVHVEAELTGIDAYNHADAEGQEEAESN